MNDPHNQKRRQRILASMVLGLAIIATSCFEPSGTVFTKIPAQDYSGVKLDLSTANDTVYIDAPTQLSYTADVQGRQIISVALFLNDTALYNDYGSFYINPALYAKGTYRLRLVMTMSAGDGSLADKLGITGVEVTRNYVAIIDSSPIGTRITAFDSTGGTMTVRWERYTRPDFQYYTLYKYCSSDNYLYNICEVIRIDSRNQNFWNDVNFVGGSVQYSVDVMGTTLIYGQHRTYHWAPKTRFTLDGKTPVLHWDKLLYYSNAKSVAVNYGAPLQNITDSIYTDLTELAGGEMRSDRITVGSSNADQNFTFNVESYRGKLVLYKAMPYHYNPSEKVYYGYSPLNNYSQVLDDSLNALNTTLQQNLAMSPQGNHVIGISYDGSVLSMTEVNPRTLEAIGTPYHGGAVANSFSGISDNGIVVFYQSYGTYALQLPDYQVIFVKPNFQTSALAISPAGTYIVSSDSIYKFNGAQYHGWMKLTGNNEYMAFADDNTLISVSGVGGMQRFDLAVKNIATYSLPDYPYTLEYDPVSQRALMWTSNGSMLVNPFTGDVLMRTPQTAHIANGKVFFFEYNASSFIWLPYTDFE